MAENGVISPEFESLNPGEVFVLLAGKGQGVNVDWEEKTFTPRNIEIDFTGKEFVAALHELANAGSSVSESVIVGLAYDEGAARVIGVTGMYYLPGEGVRVERVIGAPNAWK